MKHRAWIRTVIRTLSIAGGLVAIELGSGPGTRATAQTIPDGLRQGMPYAEARNLLLDAGWQAQFSPTDSSQDPTLAYLIEQGYGEVVSCSGTGLGLCAFEFIDAEGHQLSVSTTNNQPGEAPALFRWWLVQE